MKIQKKATRRNELQIKFFITLCVLLQLKVYLFYVAKVLFINLFNNPNIIKTNLKQGSSSNHIQIKIYGRSGAPFVYTFITTYIYYYFNETRIHFSTNFFSPILCLFLSTFQWYSKCWSFVKWNIILFFTCFILKMVMKIVKV